MKNKKLFAILTLVCFMMTLMPVAAFATEYTIADGKAVTPEFVLQADGKVAVKAPEGFKVYSATTDLSTASALVEVSTSITYETTKYYVGVASDVSGSDTYKYASAIAVKMPTGYANVAAALAAYDDYKNATAANKVAKAATLKTKLDAANKYDEVALFDAVEGVPSYSELLELTTDIAKYAAAVTAFTTITKAQYDAVADTDISAEAKVVVAADSTTYGTKLARFNDLNKALDAWDAYKADAKNANLFVAFKLAYGVTGVAADFAVVNAAEKDVAAQVNGTSDLAVAAAYVATLPGAGAPAPAPAPTPEGAADRATTAVYTVKNNPTVKIGDDVKLAYELRNAADKYAAAEALYIWFTEAGSTLPSTGVTAVAGLQPAGATPVVDGLFKTDGTKYADNALKVKFARAGEYTLHAATLADFNIADDVANTTAAEIMADLNEVKTVSTNKVVTVKGANVNSADYAVVVNIDGATQTLVDGGVLSTTVGVAADGLAKTGIELTLYEDAGLARVLQGETVKIETSSSNIEVSKEEATTNALGKVSFAVSGVREGKYEIYVTCGAYEATIKVAVGATAPTNIAVAKAPTAPINIDATANLSDIVRFVITDINGNTLTSDQANAYGEKAFTTAEDGIYASIVSAPAESDLTDEDVVLVKDTANSNLATGIYSTLAITGGLDVEGTYEFKVTLNNGKAVYVTVEAREFGTPVGIVLEYAAPSVELGGTLYAKDFLLVDKNGVTTKAAGKAELAASGYAIQNFVANGAGAGAGMIVAKADEKYLGSTITVTAVYERYNLTTTATVKVVAEAAGLMFATKTAEVDVNNAIQVVLVDAQGNRTALGEYDNETISYVVLEKPEGAKVAVNTAAADNNLANAGSFKMNLTCNKVGTVKVQAVAKVEANGVLKYYTGIGEIAVGGGQVGKSVVMSIGSSSMIADGKVATVDAKPMIQNGRTFVPFRALAEAFGATVAYDQATSAVTATLNGVEVVMTVGSPVYTVNGVEKTADVAPFISDSRTFVPVRFAAEAFGITVTPTYHEDGSVADVLFNM